MENTATRQYLTPEEIARRWRLKPSTIKHYVRTGKLRALPGVGAFRIAASEVERFERGDPIENSDPVPAQTTENGADHA